MVETAWNRVMKILQTKTTLSPDQLQIVQQFIAESSSDELDKQDS